MDDGALASRLTAIEGVLREMSASLGELKAWAHSPADCELKARVTTLEQQRVANLELAEARRSGGVSVVVWLVATAAAVMGSIVGGVMVNLAVRWLGG